MKEKLKRTLSEYLYSDYALATGVFFSMVVWALWQNDNVIQVKSYIILIFLALTYISNELFYIYFSQLELRMRLLIEPDSRLVPEVVETDRLHIRELKLSDRRLVQALSKDQEIIRFVEDIEPRMRRNEARRWIVEHMKLERKFLRTTRVLVDKDSHRPVGAVVFINGHELEYWILDSYRHKGLTFEAIQVLLDHIEKEENIVLFARTHKDNMASIKLLGRIGFMQEYIDENGCIHWLYKAIVKQSH